MSILEAKTIGSATATTVTLGAVGEAVTMAGQLKTNIIKDAGANIIFQSDGAGVLSNINSALGGTMVFISSQTASSSASISFTSGLDSTYDDYIFYYVSIHPSVDAAFLQFQGSTNGGSSYGVTITSSAYSAYQNEAGSSGVLAYTSARDLAQSTAFQYLTSGIGTDNDQVAAGSVQLFSPSSTTSVKTWYTRSNTYESTDYTQEYFMSGYFNTTSAIDAIQFKMTSGNIDAGTIYLYGIK